MGVTAGASIVVLAEVCGAFAKRMPTPATAAANRAADKDLRIIWLYELVVPLIGAWTIPEKAKLWLFFEKRPAAKSDDRQIRY